MRKLLVAMMLFFTCLVFGQDKQVKVTMKSGMTIMGQVKELVATDHITLIVAGTESIIPINEIASIGTEGGDMPSHEESTPFSPPNNVMGEFTITDERDYPDSVVFNVEGHKIVFLLVRGGKFTMGYDGRHSWSMATEPLHRVTLSSFYISKQCVSRGLATALHHKKPSKKPEKAYMVRTWEKANEIVSAISDYLEQPFRLPTEAEWEYISIIPEFEYIFEKDKHFEWCLDFYNKEYPKEEQINPTGPIKGKRHVIRSFDAGKNKWQRHFSLQTDNYDGAQVRIAINVDKINK